MSIDGSIRNKLSDSTRVFSKYFTDRPVMDNSLSDFQEKKSFTTPKKAEIPSTSKPKPKKNLKKLRGQKDIRTVLKPKKNELLSYTNDFDKVCKQSGIDIDTEQLQLAIALSKSLHDKDNINSEDTNSSSNSQSSTSQERIGKIRSTLLEYGFKVPEIKIESKTRRGKKHKKSYKLLLTTEAEKQQIIADKYSQILLGHLDSNHTSDFTHKARDTNNKLYNFATNISYNCIKSLTPFYVDNLLEPNANTIGSLLRDWSRIPGRPCSPISKIMNFEFIETDFTQSELDIILSGTLKFAQDIIKVKVVSSGDQTNESVEENTVIKNSQKVYKGKESKKIENMSEIISVEDYLKEDKVCNGIMNLEGPGKLTMSHAARSYSPDMFDDEVSSVMEQSISICTSEISSPSKPFNNETKDTNDTMDLTECVNKTSQVNVKLNEAPTCSSQGTNITKRRSNDFMEITDCVVVSSQTIIEENIDLTQSPEDDKNEKLRNNINNEVIISKDNTETMDLTQPGKGCDSNKKDLKFITIEDNNAYSMDLTQSDSNESLPFVFISGKDKSNDDTIILNEESDQLVDYISKLDSLENEKQIDLVNTESEFFRLNDEDISEVTNDINTETTSIEARNSIIENDNDTDGRRKTNCDSFFEEFIHPHLDESKNNSNKDQVISFDESSNESKDDESKNGIDLTQMSESSEKRKSQQISFEGKTLGKTDDISIDYDEIFDDVVSYVSTSKQNTCDGSKVYGIDENKNDSHSVEIDEDMKTSKNSKTNYQSQESEVFEISDNELDYSMQKSRHEVGNFDIGGLSVIDNISSARSSEVTAISSRFSEPNECEDHYLPTVHLKPTKSYENKSPIKHFDTETITPIKGIGVLSKMPVKTPNNSDYIVKTDQVTPMLDYASLSTPERNKELDKYGLKPLKRKRAIQLLTHLYNQTHPIVEDCEDLPSPSKRQKNYTQSPTKCPQKSWKSPKKTAQKSPMKSPRTLHKSPSKSADSINKDLKCIDKENIYEVTNVTPVIKDLGCNQDDWVFQKREKAKLNTCRVPLHISFHNYVSCRRGLLEAILRYEPVNIDLIHKGLVAEGYRYDPKDLLRFLDKKCITVKTTDNNNRNKKHY